MSHPISFPPALQLPVAASIPGVGPIDQDGSGDPPSEPLAGQMEFRRATPDDVPAWLDLPSSVDRDSLSDTVERIAYRALSATTLVAADANGLLASVTLPLSSAKSPGRQPKHPPEVIPGPVVLTLQLLDPSAEIDVARRLLRLAVKDAEDRGVRVLLTWIPADEERWIAALETTGFACVGYDPHRPHDLDDRGTLCFCRLKQPALGSRTAPIRSLPDISKVIVQALENLQIHPGPAILDGCTHYPFSTDAAVSQSDATVFLSGLQNSENEETRVEAIKSWTDERILVLGQGAETGYFTAHRDGAITAGLSYRHTEPNRIEVTNCYCTDGVSLGVLFDRLLHVAETEGVAAIEVFIPLTATKLLATTEVLGFIPVAFVPAAAEVPGGRSDVIIMLRYFGMQTSPESAAAPKGLPTIIQNLLIRQHDSEAMVRMFRDLAVFQGLGSGNLRELFRLGRERLYAPDQTVFRKGDPGDKAYVVVRGRVEVRLPDQQLPLVTFGEGHMFGDFALLDGRERSANAVAAEHSILLEIDRNDFLDLIQRVPSMGLTIMQNLAIHIVDRFRRMTKAVEDAHIDLRY